MHTCDVLAVPFAKKRPQDRATRRSMVVRFSPAAPVTTGRLGESSRPCQSTQVQSPYRLCCGQGSGSLIVGTALCVEERGHNLHINKVKG